jgi:glycine/D-amino acid oxidase-like deaminating enzyme
MGPPAKVVVVGGGTRFATAAKYLRVWSDQDRVTLIEPTELCPAPCRSRDQRAVQMADITRPMTR